ncbi:hypothetical protein [Vibrio viridaestus]|uniref:hypothetical protein n=1 Tax=Vibrio viridaestus TaxID=2487322 RepID=UPI00140CFBC3|nr:hypothetical protein [Vibrio viridaestus]
MDEAKIVITERAPVAIRELRVSIAKLRMSISNISNIQKQVSPSILVNKASFDMSEDTL